MKYNLINIVNTDGNITYKTISEVSPKDYRLLTENDEELRSYLNLKNLYRTILENHQEFIDYLEAYKQKLDRNSTLISHELDKVRFEINRKLLNTIFTFRTYIDYLETYYKRKYGKTSKEATTFKSLLSQLFDNNFEYRFIYKLRNFAQHCGFPIDYFAIHPKIESSIYSVDLDLNFRKKYLLENFDGWGEIVKNDIEGKDDEIDVFSCVNEFIKLIHDIDKLVFSNYPQVIGPMRSKLNEVGIKTLDQIEIIALSYKNKDDKLSIENSMFRYIIQIEKGYS